MLGLEKLDRVVWRWLSPAMLHRVQIALIYEVRKQAGDPPQTRPETRARRAAVSAAKRSAGGDACATGDGRPTKAEEYVESQQP
ncbi:MAG: hypothetical protein NTY36_01430 [Deltaproteobacteria bacterium]|nr:hypothetical protein [Deltaproteobacteria bacterium]